MRRKINNLPSLIHLDQLLRVIAGQGKLKHKLILENKVNKNKNRLNCKQNK